MLDDSPGLGARQATDDDLRAGLSWEDFSTARDRFLALLDDQWERARVECAAASGCTTPAGRARPPLSRRCAV